MLLILFLLINAFAGFFQGLTGFGHSIVATPLALTFLSKGSVLTAMVLAGTVLCLFLVRQIKEPLNRDLFWPLFSGSIVGMPVGLVILKLLPLPTFRVFVGIISIISAIVILFAKLTIHNPRKFAPIVGFLSGVLQTSAGMAGAPTVLLLSSSTLAKHATRKLLVTFFFWLSVVTLPLFALSHVLTVQGIIYGFCAVPIVLAFGYLGNKAADYLPHNSYRALALLTICAMSIYVIVSGLR